MRIITISREFGSGGRELGKRLAEEMGFAYYDKEILSMISERMQMDEGYIEKELNKSITISYPYTIRLSFLSDAVPGKPGPEIVGGTE